MTVESFDAHPLIVPPGYRIVRRFAWLPIEVAGCELWLTTYRVVQRLRIERIYGYERWSDVGYFDEIMPIKPEPSYLD